MLVVYKTLVIFVRFGPYHEARLSSAVEFFRKKGAHLVGLEVSSEGGTYRWESRNGKVGHLIDTLFPSTDYSALSNDAIKKKVREYLNGNTPDVVAISGWFRPECFEAITWAKRNGKKIILMSDSKENDYKRLWIKEYCKSRIVNLCDSAIVAGSAHAEYLNKLGMQSEDIFLGFDVVDNDFFFHRKQSARNNSPNKMSPFFLSCNRFIKRKNLLRLIKAYERYREKVLGTPWSLVLVGDGEDKNPIEQYVECHKVPSVYFPGFLNLDNLVSYYCSASCFIFPSIQDQWGLVVNEAMACGLPVLVSQRVGSAELVENGVNGWLFDPYSIDEMSNCMLKIHDMEERRRDSMGSHSLDIISNWNLDRFASSLWKASEKAIKSNSSYSVTDIVFLKIVNRYING